MAATIKDKHFPIQEKSRKLTEKQVMCRSVGKRIIPAQGKKVTLPMNKEAEKSDFGSLALSQKSLYT